VYDVSHGILVLETVNQPERKFMKPSRPERADILVEEEPSNSTAIGEQKNRRTSVLERKAGKGTVGGRGRRSKNKKTKRTASMFVQYRAQAG
jgi:hypothetical protein